MTRASFLPKLAALVGLAAPLTVVFAAVATDIGWVSFETGFGLLTTRVAWWLAIAGTALGLVAAALNIKILDRAWPWLAVGIVVPAATLAAFVWNQNRADLLPPIHETATDWSEPLGFSEAVLAARGADAWPVEADPAVSGAIADVRPAWGPWAGRRVAEINAEACPEARTVPRLVPSDEVIAALEAEGVRVIGESPWKVEGAQESPWFGRARDVVVRIEPEATDIRVSERNGLIDLGQTCDLTANIVRRLSS